MRKIWFEQKCIKSCNYVLFCNICKCCNFIEIFATFYLFSYLINLCTSCVFKKSVQGALQIIYANPKRGKLKDMIVLLIRIFKELEYILAFI